MAWHGMRRVVCWLEHDLTLLVSLQGSRGCHHRGAHTQSKAHGPLPRALRRHVTDTRLAGKPGCLEACLELSTCQLLDYCDSGRI